MKFWQRLISFVDPAHGKDIGATAVAKMLDGKVMSLQITNPDAPYTPAQSQGATGPPGEPECDCDWYLKFGFHPGPGEEWDETELDQ